MTKSVGSLETSNIANIVTFPHPCRAGARTSRYHWLAQPIHSLIAGNASTWPMTAREFNGPVSETTIIAKLDHEAHEVCSDPP